MLWNRLKQRMLTHPASYLCEGERIVTYEESAAYAERFAENLTAPCYGILCETELGTALAVLSCLAAGKTAVPLSRRYGEVHLRRILNWLQPRFLIGEKAGELPFLKSRTSIMRCRSPLLPLSCVRPERPESRRA